jgi:nuclear pore complex protein Nup210
MEDYKLYSSDESVVSVSDSRTVRAKKPGQAVIKVVSVFDFLNFDEVCEYKISFVLSLWSFINYRFLLIYFEYVSSP